MPFNPAEIIAGQTPTENTRYLKQKALRLLGKREYSQSELRQKLAPYAQSMEGLDAVLADLAEHQYQSDERYTEAYIRNQSKRYGSQRISRGLQEKGITLEAPLVLNDATLAMQLWEKRFGQPPESPQEKQKQIRYLAYKGFSFETIHALFRQLSKTKKPSILDESTWLE
jgi:regulatory protein